MKKYFYLSLTAITLVSVGLFCSCQEKAKKEIKTVENGHECVDLGLSVYWASTNVGASSPEDLGDRFAFGETETKTSFTKENYKHYTQGGASIIDKDGFKTGTVDDKWPLAGKDIAGTNDDVAHVKWGGKWRMPTKDQYQELIDKCNWKYTEKNGVEGYKISSRKTRKWIFIPIRPLNYHGISYAEWDDFDYFYRTSSSGSYAVEANYLSSDDKKELYQKTDFKGLRVRPVCE